MKFTCYTQDIRDALKFAVKCAATKKPDIQILIAARLTADDGKLTIATTDFNLGALVALPVNIAENGSCAVNAKFLLDVVSKFDNDTVTFDDASGRLNVQSGATSFNISVFDADDFPTPKFGKARSPSTKALTARFLPPCIWNLISTVPTRF